MFGNDRISDLRKYVDSLHERISDMQEEIYRLKRDTHRNMWSDGPIGVKPMVDVSLWDAIDCILANLGMRLSVEDAKPAKVLLIKEK